MLDRLLIALIICVCGVVGWMVFNRISLWRVGAKSATDPLLETLQPRTPVIVYFTTPFCAPCKTLQKPALDELKGELHESIQIVQIDATEQPDIADRWTRSWWIRSTHGRPVLVSPSAHNNDLAAIHRALASTTEVSICRSGIDQYFLSKRSISFLATTVYPFRR